MDPKKGPDFKKNKKNTAKPYFEKYPKPGWIL
jgi:hypothetical protein